MLIIEYENQILKSEKPMIVDFHAPWCGPCKAFEPMFNELESEFDNVVFAKCSVDKYPNIAAEFRAMSIPNIIVVKDGNIVKQFVGLQSKDTIRQCLKIL
jgi:thioredoxin 1